MSRRSASRWARASYGALLVLALLAPFDFRWDLGFLLSRVPTALAPALAAGDFVDAARNVALFAGWGLVWITTADRNAFRQSGTVARRPVLEALLTAAALGFSAEILQLGLPERTPSWLDAAMNATGGGAGALVGAWALVRLRRMRGRRSVLGVRAAALAVPYLGAVLLEIVFPLLRHTGPPGRYGGPLGRVAWTLEHFEWESLAVVPYLDFVLLLPAGVFCALAFWEAGFDRTKSARWTALVGATLAAIGELAHTALARPLELGPVLVHAVAVAGGGAVVATDAFARWLRRTDGRGRTLSLYLVYGLILGLWAWRPFVPELDPSQWITQVGWDRWLPLSALGPTRTLTSVADVLRSFLLFVPLGVALAVRPLRSSGRLTRLWPAVFAALLLEAGQAFVEGRFFHVTDPIVSIAGAAIAWTLVRRAGLRAKRPVWG